MEMNPSGKDWIWIKIILKVPWKIYICSSKILKANWMKRFILLSFVFFMLFGVSRADEGMWLPSLIHKLNIREMQQMGCRLTADEIYNINHASLKDAIVALDHGSCTAEIISAEGLLLTNHHCGFGDIQEHSTVENDYLKEGFWAKNHEEELPNPGKTVSFLIRVEDVTDRVLSTLSDTMNYQERNMQIRKISNEISEEATKDTHYEGRVQSLYNDNQYYLFVYETYKDVRLVGCPPKSIGKFGGDTDNWMWPRHTGDFCLFRVYTGPDGKPAEYSEENIPLQPRHFLPVSIKGVGKGDFAMILGYPGSTNRYKTSTGVEYTMKVTNPIRVEVRKEKLDIINDYMRTSPAARIQYSAKYAGSSNYYKYSIGQNKGLKNLHVVEKKKALENEFTNWVNENTQRKEKYGEALPMIQEGYGDLSDDIAREYMMEALIRGPEIFMVARQLSTLERFLQNPDKENSPLEGITGSLKNNLDRFFKDYHPETDQKIVAALTERYHENVAPEYHPSFFKKIEKRYKGDFEKFAEKMFSKTILDDPSEMEEFLADPKLRTLKKDEVFQAAKSIFTTYEKVATQALESQPLLEEGRRLFVAGLMEMEEDRIFYPDANSTMRLTYGQVLDYVPRDGVLYNHYTTIRGYLEKEIPGDDEFHVPSKMKELILEEDYGRYADEDGTIHTCFLTNNDITGGNSGSPVMNANGELIGIAFDGNWEAMSGDLAFEPELQRCISVDIRFVLWIIDKYAGASHLIDEMTIVE
jgi:hypothetical protein